MKNTQSIDLGALQQRLNEARKVNATNQKALLKAEADAERGLKVLVDAQQALEAASKAVLKGG